MKNTTKNTTGSAPGVTSRHKRIIKLQELPRERLPQTSPDLGRLLEDVLRAHLHARPGYCVVLPSPLLISGHLGLPMLVVLHGLQELGRYGYHYELSALDCGVEVRVHPVNRHTGPFAPPPRPGTIRGSVATFDADSPLRQVTR